MDHRDGLDDLREELIASLHSDKFADSRIRSQLADISFVKSLTQVCRPYDYYSNDPRMKAAYYLSECSPILLHNLSSEIEELLRLPYDGETLNGNIAFHLIKCIDRLKSETSYLPSSDMQGILNEIAS